MLDYHLHLWPHGTPAAPVTVEQIAAYCRQAASVGVTEIAVTEHLFRFVQAGPDLAGFWEDDDNPAMRSAMAAYWAEHATADLDQYVEAIEAAKAAGLPVKLGLEVDHYPGRMDAVARLLAGYPFDVLLGSVHWLGAWGFDNWAQPAFADEWQRRGTEGAWIAYVDAVEDLAASGVCDVLAHLDLCKVTGRVPADPEPCYERLAAAAAGADLVVEVSSAGWRKPAADAYPATALLADLHRRGVVVTTASDAHCLVDVGRQVQELRPRLAAAGYDTVTSFSARRPTPVALS